MKRARFIAPARREFLAEVVYYNGKEPGLGTRFAAAVEEAATRALALLRAKLSQRFASHRHFHRIETMKSQDVILALGALAQESRLAVFRLLVARGPEGYTPSEMVEKLELPAPTLSFHLKALTRARLLSVRREGRFLYYSANFPQMQAVIGFLTDKCCSLSDVDCDIGCRPVSAQAKRRRA